MVLVLVARLHRLGEDRAVTRDDVAALALNVAQELYGLGDDLHGLTVRTDDPYKAPEVKKELACRYLEDPQRRLTDVAELLGFSTLSAFSRWYRTSFGRSARDRRAALARARGR